MLKILNILSVGSSIQWDDIHILTGRSSRNGWIYFCRFWLYTTVSPIIFIVDDILISIFFFSFFIFFPFFRSILHIVAVVQFMDSWNVGRSIPVNIFVLIVNVLAVYLSWAAAKWAKIPNILSSEIDCNNANVVVCHCSCHVGKVQRTSRSHLQPFCRHRKFSGMNIKLLALNCDIFSLIFFFKRVFKHFSTFPVQCTYSTWLYSFWKRTVNSDRCHSLVILLICCFCDLLVWIILMLNLYLFVGRYAPKVFNTFDDICFECNDFIGHESIWIRCVGG